MDHPRPWKKVGASSQETLILADPGSRKRSLKDLNHEDPATRSRTAWLLANAPEPLEGLILTVSRRLKKEREAPVKASMCLALGALEARAGTETHREALENLTGAYNDFSPKMPPDEVRVAATIAISWMAPMWLNLDMLDWLRKHHTIELDESTFPWLGGKLGELAAQTLATNETIDVTAAQDALRKVMAEHPKPQPPNQAEHSHNAARWPAQVNTLALWLSQRMLAPLGDRAHDEPLPEDLSDDQVAFLKFGIDHGISLGEAKRGLDFQWPPDGKHTTWRRYLGLDQSGPLEQRVALEYKGAIRRWPIWKWFRALAHGMVEAEPLQKSLREQLRDSDLIALGRDAATLCYGLPHEGTVRPSRRAVLLLELLGELDTTKLAEAADVVNDLRRVAKLKT